MRNVLIGAHYFFFFWPFLFHFLFVFFFCLFLFVSARKCFWQWAPQICHTDLLQEGQQRIRTPGPAIRNRCVVPLKLQSFCSDPNLWGDRFRRSTLRSNASIPNQNLPRVTKTFFKSKSHPLPLRSPFFFIFYF